MKWENRRGMNLKNTVIALLALNLVIFFNLNFTSNRLPAKKPEQIVIPKAESIEVTNKSSKTTKAAKRIASRRR